MSRILFLWFLLVLPLGAVTLHVRPDAPAGGDGSAGRPFRELDAAWTAALDVRQSGRDVTLALSPGTHRIQGPLRLGPGALPQNPGKLRLQGSVGSIISGGKSVPGWQAGPDGSWSKAWDGPPVREMFLGDTALPRARFPAEGWLRVEKSLPDRRSGFLTAGDLPAIGPDAELAFLHDWSVTRVGVAGIQGRELRTVGPIGYPADHFAIDFFEPHPRYALENDPAFLTIPGTWCHDLAGGLLRYRPHPGQDPAAFAPVVPMAEKLIDWSGSPDHPLAGISVDQITFVHCRWQPPAAGYAEGQATKHDPRGRPGDPPKPQAPWTFVPWAVDVAWAHGITFSRVTFTQLGGSGVRLGAGCRDGAIIDCRVIGVAGNGIGIGESGDRLIEVNGQSMSWTRAAPDQAATANRITGCEITGCGRQFHGAVGIWIGLARRSLVRANHVHHLPYTGISCGWIWNATPSPCAENRIESNHIHHVMQLLSDGGGIYTLGHQPGTLLARNHIHDIPVNLGRAESNGMFLDEGSSGLVIEGNLIHGLARAPLRFHKAGPNTVKDNTWVIPADQPAIRFNNTPEDNITATGNTGITPGEAVTRAAAWKFPAGR